MKKKLVLAALVLFIGIIAGVAYLAGIPGLSKVDETTLGKPLAVIREIRTQVRHKYPGDFFWRTASDGQKLFNGSEVFVGEKSAAVLHFSGNRRARLSENTLLRISEDSGGRNNLILALNDGSFNLRSFPNDNTGIILRVDQAGLRIGPGSKYDLYVKKKEHALGLAMAAGQIAIEGVEDKKILTQGESVVVRSRGSGNAPPVSGNQGETSKVELYIDQTIDPSIKLLQPVEKQVVYKNETNQFFVWESDPAEHQTLEYSTHPDFYQIDGELTVTGTKTIPVPVAKLSGDVFWRVVSYKEGVPHFSSASYFKVANLQKTSLTEPRLTFIERGKWQLDVSINNPAANARYEFQVSRTERYQDLYDAFVGPAPFRSLIDQSGDFYLRVRRLYGNDLVSDWSDPLKLHVRSPLTAPILKVSSHGEKVGGVVAATLSWTGEEAAEYFLLRTSFNADMRDSKITRLPKSKTEFEINEYLTRPYYISLQTEAKEGEVSAASNIVTLQPSPTAMKNLAASAAAARAAELQAKKSEAAATADRQNALSITAPEDNLVAYVGKPIRFEWSGSAPALEFSTVASFTQDLEKLNTSGRTSTEVTRKKAGFFYWRLIAANGKTTPPRKITVVPPSDINLEKAELRLIERGRWEITAKVRDAKNNERFELQLSRTADFQTVTASRTGPLSGGVEVTDPGTYYLRAQKIYTDKPSSGWSNVISTEVRPPLSAPELLKEKEDLLSPVTVRVTMKWKPVPHAAGYIIEMADTPKFGNVTLSVNLNSPEYAIDHATKEPSYVRVLARSKEGEISPASAVFKIKGVLPGPSVERYEITFANIDEKQAQDQLHVLWNHRKNAKKYLIEVGRNESLKDAQRFETRNIEFFMPVQEEGWYYFRLIPKSESPDFFDTPSQVYGVEYRKQADLLAAALEAPAKGNKFKAGDAIRFAWGQILGAAWYELELAKNTDFSGSVVYKVEARDYYLNRGLSKGRWYFRMRGRSSSQTSPWSDASFIEVQ
ncbi:hypothetical protein AB1A81_13945 [Bdellovibrio bacteriovorus]|uniref:FecR protein domain-containing protein n=1 Tax=Bdellovibrio bacteriovorus (strain ATCC 15356 / DSM 50701 / NCIMB 9529 / HD100) TaxID=264462 RepID=Q6MIW4_BDEBA|nr:hypothetical protein [Bdellovibrio bacteriovorus]CAE80799.1 hypothetical protein predicted by Glimmer/Critica [Bdellovibrio bacteriovorus HD100]